MAGKALQGALSQSTTCACAPAEVSGVLRPEANGARHGVVGVPAQHAEDGPRRRAADAAHAHQRAMRLALRHLRQILLFKSRTLRY